MVAPTLRLPNRDGGEPDSESPFCLGWTEALSWLDEGAPLAGRRHRLGWTEAKGRFFQTS